MSAEDKTVDLDTLLFFDQRPSALPIFLAFEETILKLFPSARKRVQKTQITFYNRRVFACASFLRVKRKSELPDPCLVVTLGLPGPLASGRVAVQCEPYPGRWTTHIVIGGADEIDDELIAWMEQAYSFAERK